MQSDELSRIFIELRILRNISNSGRRRKAEREVNELSGEMERLSDEVQAHPSLQNVFLRVVLLHTRQF